MSNIKLIKLENSQLWSSFDFFSNYFSGFSKQILVSSFNDFIADHAYPSNNQS